MHVVRRLSLLLTAFSLGIAVLLGALSARPSVSADAARSLAAATHYFDSTVVLARTSRPRGVRGEQLAISIGYLERLRLGLGSPFRLVNEALVDPRLDRVRRNRVAWALLGKLRRGDAYMVDPAALDGLGPWGPERIGATGAAHLALIERTIRSAEDPREGELTVRLAYAIASARGTISSTAQGVAVQAAALLRDKALAELDLRDVLADANEARRDVMDVLIERRNARTLRVEQPQLTPLSASLQTAAMERVPEVLEQLAVLDRVYAPNVDAPGPHASLLNSHFAEQLEEVGGMQPPLAQVAVTISTRARTSIRATNEETLVASHAEALSQSDSMRRANSLAVLASAVALRAVAQSTPWFTGDGGPDAADLNVEFGLSEVAFTPGVPRPWRPYYMRELQGGLRDLQRVLPGYSASGLRVHFTNEALRDSALAMHEPRTRTLHLSIATSAGTLAHELSHDLDWQAARRLFADGMGYSTDRAMQEQTGLLSASMKGLAAARILRSNAGPATNSSPGASARPAELFARGTDWFVATALAQQGRSNGFLSVAEDGLLTGYAAGVPTAVGVAGTASLLSAIGEMTFLTDSARNAFEAQWADPMVVDPALLVRRVIETPIPYRRMWPRDKSAAAIVSATRVVACGADESAETMARERLLMLAIDARAHALAQARTRNRRFLASRSDVDRWEESIRATLVTELSSALPNQGFVPIVPWAFRATDASCERSLF